jgi:hypothetical protein
MSQWTGVRDFCIELRSGKFITATVSATLIHDSNYGADADGNRGVAMTFLEDLSWDAPLVDDDGVELSEQEQLEAEDAILKAAEDHCWDEDAASAYDKYEHYEDTEEDDDLFEERD